MFDKMVFDTSLSIVASEDKVCWKLPLKVLTKKMIAHLFLHYFMNGISIIILLKH